MWTARLGAVLDLLLPPACAGCGGPLLPGTGELPVCPGCRLALGRVPAPRCPRCGAPRGTGAAEACLDCVGWPEVLVGAHASCALGSTARALVHALKYQGWRDVGRMMGLEIARTCPRAIRGYDALVPVPTSARTVRRRGFNQARVIADGLSGVLEIPVLPCLERTGSRGTQTSLKPMERRANVRGAFVLSGAHRETIGGRRLVLVDDVITTGATLLSATRALAFGGPATVFACAFARTVPFSQESHRTDGMGRRGS